MRLASHRVALHVVSSLVVLFVLQCGDVNRVFAQTPNGFKVEYTGALFGYYQINDTDERNYLQPVKDFLATHNIGNKTLLIGMGDNFAPEYRASIQMELFPGNPLCTMQPVSNQYPQALYKNDDRMLILKNVPVYCDNVARFLMLAGYRAVVPGREDFLYTATWLRGIALGLDSASDPNNPDSFKVANANHRLTMLAANLRVQGSEPGAADKKSSQVNAPKPCSLLFAQTPGNDATTCTNDATNPTTTAMDWLDRIDLSLDPNTGVELKIEQETSLLCNFPPRSRPDLQCTPNDPPRSTIHEASTLQLRRTLMQNQAFQMLSMLHGVDDNVLQAVDKDTKSKAGDEITAALTALSDDKSYILNEHAPLWGMYPKGTDVHLNTEAPEVMPGGKTPLSGAEAAQQLLRGLNTLDCSKPKSGTPLEDLCRFGNQLAANFATIDAKNSSGSAGHQAAKDSLLLDEPARRAGRRLLLRAIAKEQEGSGYTIDHEGIGGPGTLIVGVVGKDTMKAVSSTNLTVLDNTKTGIKGKVISIDPLRTLLAVLRGANQTAQDDRGGEEHFDRIVVLAQMPRGDAEELGARLKTLLNAVKTATTRDNAPLDISQMPVLILSEAQAGRASPNLTQDYTTGEMIPVLTPHPPYHPEGFLAAPAATADFSFYLSPDLDIVTTLENTLPAEAKKSSAEAQSTLYLLRQELKASQGGERLALTLPASCAGANIRPASAIPKAPLEKNCERDLSAQLMDALRIGQGIDAKSDVVLLEQRDLYYGNIPEGYAGYEVCPTSPTDTGCRLRVALDRVLWKGDYAERVMVSGGDLVTMLKTSQQQSLLDSSLTPSDVSRQELVSFGIVQPISPNLSKPGSESGEFLVPQDGACGTATDAITDPSAYCINGQPIRSDAAYWITTSDHLANDEAVYSSLKSTPHGYQQASKKFLTGEIAVGLRNKEPMPPKVEEDNPTETSKKSEWGQQMRPLMHLDISKLVAGFSFREPQGGNGNAADLQGAADSRASTPSQQELDLESLSRFSFDLPVKRSPLWFKNEQLDSSLGVQTAAEYDRAEVGNLTYKPPSTTYALNSLTVGPFLQFRMPQWKGPRGTWQLNSDRALPRTLLVLTPFQYQRQFTGTYLIFPFSQSPPSTTPPTVSEQFTVHAPVATSWFEKAGLRHEDFGNHRFLPDSGSYIESGFEFGTQESLLSSVALTSDGVTVQCTALSQITITGCFAAAAKTKGGVSGFSIDSTTAPAAPGTMNYWVYTGSGSIPFSLSTTQPLTTPVTAATQHAMGLYWDIHMVKQLAKSSSAKTTGGTTSSAKSGINLTLDTKGDWFSPRSSANALNTQPHYDIPLSVSLNFPVLRNLSLSPTYTGFYYSSQVSGQGIVINSFSIAAKWYFARDTAVPPARQLVYTGPSSADQTNTAKMK